MLTDNLLAFPVEIPWNNLCLSCLSSRFPYNKKEIKNIVQKNNLARFMFVVDLRLLTRFSLKVHLCHSCENNWKREVFIIPDISKYPSSYFLRQEVIDIQMNLPALHSCAELWHHESAVSWFTAAGCWPLSGGRGGEDPSLFLAQWNQSRPLGSRKGRPKSCAKIWRRCIRFGKGSQFASLWKIKWENILFCSPISYKINCCCVL